MHHARELEDLQAGGLGVGAGDGRLELGGETHCEDVCGGRVV